MVFLFGKKSCRGLADSSNCLFFGETCLEIGQVYALRSLPAAHHESFLRTWCHRPPHLGHCLFDGIRIAPRKPALKTGEKKCQPFISIFPSSSSCSPLAPQLQRLLNGNSLLSGAFDLWGTLVLNNHFAECSMIEKEQKRDLFNVQLIALGHNQLLGNL